MDGNSINDTVQDLYNITYDIIMLLVVRFCIQRQSSRQTASVFYYNI